VRRHLGRALAGLGFVALTWFFGGLPGLGVGIVLVVLRLRGLGSNLLWPLGVLAIAAAPFAVLVQGLPPGAAGPEFGARHAAATLLVGIGLASLALAAFLEIPTIRRRPASPSDDPEARPGHEGSPDPQIP
jgi:hypothetical protein